MRPAIEILEDDALPPPAPTAGVRAWEAWCDRLAPGEWESASREEWLRGLLLATSGLVVPAAILDDPRLDGESRVVLAAIDAPAELIFGHEQAFGGLVSGALSRLAAAGAITRSTRGWVTT